MLTNPTIHAPKPFPRRAFLKFAGMNLCVAVVLLALGYFPTVRMLGADGIIAMLCGVAVTMLATLAGMVPVLLASHGSAQDRPQAIMMGMAIRLGLLVILSASLVLGGVAPYRPLLIWIAISFLVFLMIDTLVMYAVLVAANQNPTTSEESSAR